MMKGKQESAADRLINAANEKRCDGCGHMKICSPFRAVLQMLENYEAPPFDAMKLAEICDEYIDWRSIKMLKEGL